LHNLRYFLRLMQGAREAIRAGGYAAYVEQSLAPYRKANEPADS
jgi:queuine/archaeosine tRNA-ribosyltransferase